jgi:hypothetical protein
VAVASTNVPPAVAREEIVTQSAMGLLLDWHLVPAPFSEYLVRA